MNALKQMNAIFAAAAQMRLNAAEQLMLMHLFDKFNRSRWASAVEMSDAEMAQRCCLSKPQVYRAKVRLRELGLIAYTGGKGRNGATKYSLVNLCDINRDISRDISRDVENGAVTGAIDTSAEAVRDINRDINRDIDENSYIRARDKTDKQKDSLKGEGADAKFLNSAELEATETVKQIRVHVTKADVAQVVALNNLYGAEDVKDAISTVNQIRACVTFSDVANLLKLNDSYGKERVAQALTEVAQNRVNVTFTDIIHTLTAAQNVPLKIIKKPTKPKGVAVYESTYSIPVDRPDDPWANY